MSATNPPSEADEQSIDDLWGEAMSEQMSTEASSAPASAKNEQTLNLSDDLNLVLDIPVKMTVELGRTKMTIKELLRLSQGSVVPLEGLAGEPLDILINGYLIAQGEVVVVSDKFGVRITDIITPSERMQRLSR
ncbi:flagellar motor switch protein FliN [Candidatus Pantoea deserta]|uniref:Flagellar motor switch protein FliN n=1 Tax=Candidatus Pantoea deserta TaxID=1869313 RepID=A0A3N4PDU4_9GAMM|nr:flagellar motor switch protein FliN [Pantoea deserta]RPE04609.1 flagellar motor switch protein FliN [Pantoea deserta]